MCVCESLSRCMCVCELLCVGVAHDADDDDDPIAYLCSVDAAAAADCAALLCVGYLIFGFLFLLSRAR